MFSCGFNLGGKSIGFGLAFGVLGCSPFAFARQTFRLDTQTLERALELSCNFAESLGNGGVLQQLRACTLDFSFS